MEIPPKWRFLRKKRVFSILGTSRLAKNLKIEHIIKLPSMPDIKKKGYIHSSKLTTSNLFF